MLERSPPDAWLLRLSALLSFICTAVSRLTIICSFEITVEGKTCNVQLNWRPLCFVAVLAAW